VQHSARVLSFHHCSLVVADLDRTIAFYSQLLGFRLRSRKVYEWDELYGKALLEGSAEPSDWADGVKIDIAQMDIHGALVEFEQWLSPRTAPSHGNPSVAGSAHLAVTVANIDQVVTDLEAAGAKIISPVETFMESGRRPWRYSFFLDPDRNFVELVEDVPIGSLLETLGTRVRETRQLRGLTLKVAAKRAGISTAYLSQIERGESNASIGSLASIASVLGVAFDRFLMLEEGDPALLSAVNGQSLRAISPETEQASEPTRGSTSAVDGKVEKQELTGAQETLRVTRFLCHAGSSVEWHNLDPRVRCVVSVLQGTIQCALDESSKVLSAGMSMSCLGSTSRRYLNVGSESAEVIEAVATM